ncbi:MAG: hypothetical protein Q9175_004238 [Cornicularia normoerica]
MALKGKPDPNTEKLLMAAAKFGYSGSVTLMLLSGTAPDIQDEDGVAALHVAALSPADNTQFADLLPDARANINIHGGPFGNALQAATLSGKAKTVLILRQHDASPDRAGGSYGTALQIGQNGLEDWERKADGGN